VPGAAPAVLIIHGHPPRLPSSYGKPSAYHPCHPGEARLELRVRGQKQAAANLKMYIGRGHYTVIAVPAGNGVGLRVYKDDGVEPGEARMRTINAAAELGRADMRVDGRTVAQLHPGAATRYASLPPGRHNLEVTRPGGEGGALASRDDVPLVAGTSSTAIVVGSRGMPTQVLLVSDETAGPAAAPATGFLGDVGDGSGWLLVILAAIVAGTLGGTSYLTIARRPGATVPAPAAAPIPPPPPTPPAAAIPPVPAPPVGPEPVRVPVRPPRSPERGRVLAVGAVLTAGRFLVKARSRRHRA
jgi:hypothetical protein